MDEIRLRLIQQRKVRLLCPHLYGDLALSQHPGSSYCTRAKDSSWTRGYGLCVYINDAWRSNVVRVDGQCLPDVSFFMLRCWPYYLPREFTSVFVVAVYIPPDTNSKNALQELYEVISSHMTKQPDGIFIVTGYMNQTDLRTALPKFSPHVHTPTRGSNTLDHSYTNIPGSYNPPPLWTIKPHFPASPAYLLPAD